VQLQLGLSVANHHYALLCSGLFTSIPQPLGGSIFIGLTTLFGLRAWLQRIFCKILIYYYRNSPIKTALSKTYSLSIVFIKNLQINLPSIK
jgi:hypothetical protein